MCTRSAMCCSVLSLSCALTMADPPGYFRENIGGPAGFLRGASLNNNGTVVFCMRSDPYNSDSSELFRYQGGQLQQLTLDAVRDEFPSINDDGVIAWARGSGPDGPSQITMLDSLTGHMWPLTSGTSWHYQPQINASGHVAWYTWLGTGCGFSDADILYYDGTAIVKLSEPGYSNQGAKLNDNDEVVWTRYNQCTSPWSSAITRYSAGVVSILTTQGQSQAQRCDIANDGSVAWYYKNGLNDEIQLWRAGVVTTLTTWGSGLYMSKNGGYIAFNRWHEASQTWQLCLFHDGHIWDITSDPFWNFDGRPNDRGELVWHAGTPFDVGVGHLVRFPVGDMNCDNSTNVLDINGFVLAVSNPSLYASVNPACDVLLADVNADESVDVLDINPFVGLLGARR
ncbi:hypothetical protein RAS1_27800 [Phycisphaerae bacterium RAS1]|nr:hypothetical protein RAS1_27800 [Phycisphaerae bacterium RAS1]